MKIYDTIQFLNETSLLEARFKAHSSWADFFILVEGNRTFTGLPNKIVYTDEEERFKKWQHKIIHIKIYDYLNSDPTKVEAHHRDVIQDLNFEDDDILTILDVDEFLKEDSIDRFVKSGFGVAIPELTAFGYYMNWYAGDQWINGRIMRAGELKKQNKTMNQIRQEVWTYNRMQNMGWHFGNILMNDGAERIKRKCESIADTFLNSSEVISGIQESIDNRTWFGHKSEHLMKHGFPGDKEATQHSVLQLNDPKLPKWISENKEWFLKEGLIKL